MRYRATLADGTVFEDTTAGKDSLSIAMAKLFPGFAEGLGLMSAGSRYRLFIPSKLAFTGQGWKDRVEPNVPVIYEVELLAVAAKK